MKKTKKRNLFFIISIYGLILIVTTALVVFIKFPRPDSHANNELERKVEVVFKEEIMSKGQMKQGTYTLNLNYLKKNGYDVTNYEERGCDLTKTYAIVYVGDNGEITNIVSQTDCK